MSQNFIISLPLVNIECKQTLKDGLRSNCPLKQFLDSDEAIYASICGDLQNIVMNKLWSRKAALLR